MSYAAAYGDDERVPVSRVLRRENHPLGINPELAEAHEDLEAVEASSKKWTFGVAAGALLVAGTFAAGALGLNGSSVPVADQASAPEHAPSAPGNGPTQAAPPGAGAPDQDQSKPADQTNPSSTDPSGAAPGQQAPGVGAPGVGAPGGDTGGGGTPAPAPQPQPQPQPPAPQPPAPQPPPEQPNNGGLVGGVTDGLGNVVGGVTDGLGGVVGGLLGGSSTSSQQAPASATQQAPMSATQAAPAGGEQPAMTMIDPLGDLLTGV